MSESDSIWARRLRENFGSTRDVRFSSKFKLTDEGGTAVIELDRAAVESNMQDNNASFEAWALVLHRWCGAERVELRWEMIDVPSDCEPGASRWPREQLHYQRFLYRVRNFYELLSGQWFMADVARAQSQSRFRPGTMFLNAPGDRPENGARKTTPEAVLEWQLHLDTEGTVRAYCGATNADDPWIADRQIPVGLFSSDVPSGRSAIFPGGAGAIDLAALAGNHLWLFELKAGGNYPVGTLSELLFYVAVMRDLCLCRIKPPRGVAVDGKGLNSAKLARATRITGVMLAPELHPLLDSQLLSQLNRAIAQTWNAEALAPQVSLEAASLRAGAVLTRLF